MLNTNAVLGNRDENTRPEPRSSGYLGTTTRPGPSAQMQPASAHESDHLAVAASGEEPRNKLTVGPNIKMKGVEVTDCDTVMVEGQIEATLDSRLVHIAEAGVFTGTVNVDVAEIWGRFEGNLTVRKQLIIHPSGRASGRICYAKIKVEEGGEISGTISTSTASPAGKSAPLTMPAAVKRIPQGREKGKPGGPT